MQRIMIGLSVLGGLTALGETHTLNHYTAERLYAAAGVTNSAAAMRFAAQADGIVKTGAGAALVKAGDLASHEPIGISVHEGMLQLSASTPAAAAVTPPSVITGKASLWLQAGVNVVAPAGDAEGIEHWYDVREPAATQLPTGVTGSYPMARAIGVYNKTTQTTDYQYPVVQSIVTPAGSRDAMYFRGAPSTCWMRFYAADRQGETALTCFHTFAVVFPQNTWGYLYGTMSSTVPLFSEPGDTTSSLSANGKYFNLGGTMNVAAARFYVDGELVDPSSSVRKCLQVQEMEFDHRQAVWECLFRNGNNGRYGGDWLGEVIVFARHLSAEERLAVSDYLAAKWLGKAPTAPALALSGATGSTTEVGLDGTVSVSGEGDVIHTGTGALTVLPAKGAEGAATFAQRGGGSVRAEVDALRVLPTAGETTVVDLGNFDEQVLSTGAAVAADTVALAGSGSVRVARIPAETRVLSASARVLALGESRPPARAVASGEIYATIVNGDAEQRFAANPNVGSEDRFAPSADVAASGTLDDWTYESAGGFSILKVQNDLGTWKFNLNATDDRDRFACVQGKGCLSLKKQTVASTAMSVPADGDYEFSYFATARRGYDAGFLNVSIVTADGTTVHDVCRHPILLAEGWRPYRYLVRGVKAGSYRLRLRLDCDGTDKSAHIDDLKMRLVAVADVSSGRCAVPNGGFNCTTGTLANAATFCKDNLPLAWTLTQGTVGSAVTTARDAMNLDVALATRWHRPAQNTVAPSGSYYNPSGRYGEAQLNFRSNAGMAESAEFTVPAGRWKVCVNAGNWTFRAGADVVGDTQYNYLSTKWNKLYGNPNLSPTCGASVLVNGTETDLGATPAIESYTMADYTVATAFTVAEGDRVKIRLRQDTAPNASGPAMMALNEVWLERAEDPKNLVRNGSFEAGDADNLYYGVTDWTLEKHTDLAANSNVHRFNPYKPTEQGTTRCTGSWALLLVDAASAKQEIAFPSAGSYRLAFKARARFSDVNGTVDNATYGGNRVRAWLEDAAGNARPILETADVYSTNFVAHAAPFTVPSAGTYTLHLNGCNLYPNASTGRTAKSQRVVYIDDVEVVPLAGNDVVAPDLPKDLSLELAAGTALRLDYVGTNTIGSLKLGDRRYSGIIDASHPSGLVSGAGALYVAPRGFMFLVR